MALKSLRHSDSAWTITWEDEQFYLLCFQSATFFPLHFFCERCIRLRPCGCLLRPTCVWTPLVQCFNLNISLPWLEKGKGGHALLCLFLFPFCELSHALLCWYSCYILLFAHARSAAQILTCAHRMRVHFCPQHWLVCHLAFGSSSSSVSCDPVYAPLLLREKPNVKMSTSKSQGRKRGGLALEYSRVCVGEGEDEADISSGVNWGRLLACVDVQECRH